MMEASPILNIDSNHDAAPLIAETAKFTNIEPINPIHNHHMSYLPDIISRDISKSDIANEIVEHTRSMINESLKPIKYNVSGQYMDHNLIFLIIYPDRLV